MGVGPGLQTCRCWRGWTPCRGAAMQAGAPSLGAGLEKKASQEGSHVPVQSDCMCLQFWELGRPGRLTSPVSGGPALAQEVRPRAGRQAWSRWVAAWGPGTGSAQSQAGAAGGEWPWCPGRTGVGRPVCPVGWAGLNRTQGGASVALGGHGPRRWLFHRSLGGRSAQLRCRLRLWFCALHGG